MFVDLRVIRECGWKEGKEKSKKVVRLLAQVQCDRGSQVAGLRSSLSYVSCSPLQLGEIVPVRAVVTSRYGQQTTGVIPSEDQC
jgi:hypothetical protein